MHGHEVMRSAGLGGALNNFSWMDKYKNRKHNNKSTVQNIIK